MTNKLICRKVKNFLSITITSETSVCIQCTGIKLYIPVSYRHERHKMLLYTDGNPTFITVLCLDVSRLGLDGSAKSRTLPLDGTKSRNLPLEGVKCKTLPHPSRQPILPVFILR